MIEFQILSGVFLRLSQQFLIHASNSISHFMSFLSSYVCLNNHKGNPPAQGVPDHVCFSCWLPRQHTPL